MTTKSSDAAVNRNHRKITPSNTETPGNPLGLSTENRYGRKQLSLDHLVGEREQRGRNSWR